MKKRLFIALIVLLALTATASLVWAGGPWEVKVEGNGIVSGGSLPSYGVVETDIGWNFKMNFNSEVQGHLNIVEKLTDGTTRHFQLHGYEVLPVGDPGGRPILFNCVDDGSSDSRSVRVEGYDSEGRLVAAHFRDSEHNTLPSTVWYWVQDPPGNYITNTNARLSVSNLFAMECSD
jgi:hypothetical protein